LLNGGDIWYDVTNTTNSADLAKEQQYNLLNVILPYLNTINTNEDLLAVIDAGQQTQSPVGKLILLAELGKIDSAQIEFNRLLMEEPKPNLKRMIVETGKTYGLIA